MICIEIFDGFWGLGEVIMINILDCCFYLCFVGDVKNIIVSGVFGLMNGVINIVV